MHQVDRIVKVLYWLSRGHELTTDEISKRFGGAVAIRDIQRDLARIDELQIGLQCDIESRPYRWFFPLGEKPILPAFTSDSELLSLYMLKAYLKTFRGTEIESNVNGLLKKIEKSAPGEIFWSEKSEILWDQNIGEYDYAPHSHTIQSVITAILRKKPVKVTYIRVHDSERSTFTAQLHRMFVYQGGLYVACFIPKYDNYIALSIQGITQLSEDNKTQPSEKPFELERYAAHRFGVFAGYTQDVAIEIQKEYRVYFENRLWHSTQKFEEGTSGRLILSMNVPIAPELINWLMGWGDGVKVLSPKTLKDKIVDGHRKAFLSYKESTKSNTLKK